MGLNERVGRVRRREMLALILVMMVVVEQLLGEGQKVWVEG